MSLLCERAVCLFMCLNSICSVLSSFYNCIFIALNLSSYVAYCLIWTWWIESTQSCQLPTMTLSTKVNLAQNGTDKLFAAAEQTVCEAWLQAERLHSHRWLLIVCVLRGIADIAGVYTYLFGVASVIVLAWWMFVCSIPFFFLSRLSL